GEGTRRAHPCVGSRSAPEGARPRCPEGAGAAGAGGEPGAGPQAGPPASPGGGRGPRAAPPPRAGAPGPADPRAGGGRHGPGGGGGGVGGWGRGGPGGALHRPRPWSPSAGDGGPAVASTANPSRMPPRGRGATRRGPAPRSALHARGGRGPGPGRGGAGVTGG